MRKTVFVLVFFVLFFCLYIGYMCVYACRLYFPCRSSSLSVTHHHYHHSSFKSFRFYDLCCTRAHNTIIVDQYHSKNAKSVQIVLAPLQISVSLTLPISINCTLHCWLCYGVRRKNVSKQVWRKRNACKKYSMQKQYTLHTTTTVCYIIPSHPGIIHPIRWEQVWKNKDTCDKRKNIFLEK